MIGIKNESYQQVLWSFPFQCTVGLLSGLVFSRASAKAERDLSSLSCVCV